MKKTTGKVRLILKPALVILLLLVWGLCKVQPNTAVIKVINGAAFNTNGIVKYTILCSQTCYCYVGLETLVNGKWREIVLDITSQAPSKAAVLKRAIASKPLTGQFSVRHVPAVYIGANRYFRLKLNYGNSPVVVNHIVLSENFSIRSI